MYCCPSEKENEFKKFLANSFSIFTNSKLVISSSKNFTKLYVTEKKTIVLRDAFKKKIAQNETFAYLGGRGVKKIPFIYIIKNGT